MTQGEMFMDEVMFRFVSMFLVHLVTFTNFLPHFKSLLEVDGRLNKITPLLE